MKILSSWVGVDPDRLEEENGIVSVVRAIQGDEENN